MYVLGLILEKNQKLKKLDTVLVTWKEKDNVIVFNTRLRKDKRLWLDKLKKENPVAPPPNSQEEEDQYKQKEDSKKS